MELRIASLFIPVKRPVISTETKHLKAMFLPNYKEASAEEKIKIIATRQKEALLPI
jgi:hypothetical protein